MSEKAGLIFKKIPQIMHDVGAIDKGQYNRSQGFKFRGIDDVYNHMHPILAKHGVFTTAEIIDRQRTVGQTKSGSRMFHCVTSFKFRFYAEDGSYVEVDADGEAMDTGDKAANKCASIAHKYALLQTFCIPTADIKDPDSESHTMLDPNAQPPDVLAGAPAGDSIHGPSDKQIKRLYAIMRNTGKREADVQRLCQQMYQVSQFRNLTQEQYQKICDLLQVPQNGNRH
jgi:hypothetical protein